MACPFVFPKLSGSSVSGSNVCTEPPLLRTSLSVPRSGLSPELVTVAFLGRQERENGGPGQYPPQRQAHDHVLPRPGQVPDAPAGASVSALPAPRLPPLPDPGVSEANPHLRSFVTGRTLKGLSPWETRLRPSGWAGNDCRPHLHLSR